jgi:folate-dependent phosphoribosylglycinamide formyltransferase PurN
MLVASDLVVLPYDAGLSERRSSFLSAMSCGANVWTTTGDFTPPMSLEGTHVHTVTSQAWAAGDESVMQSIVSALQESSQRVLERRVKNLEWAAERSWNARVQSISNFLPMIK